MSLSISPEDRAARQQCSIIQLLRASLLTIKVLQMAALPGAESVLLEQPALCMLDKTYRRPDTPGLLAHSQQGACLTVCSCYSHLVLQKQRRPRTANKQDDLDKVMNERMSLKHEEPLNVPTLNTAEDFEKAIEVSHMLGWPAGRPSAVVGVWASSVSASRHVRLLGSCIKQA